MTDKECNLIKQQFKDVISYSQSFIPNDEVINRIFDVWKSQKSYFISSYLHGNLIYEYGSVELHLNPEKKDLLFDEFINQIGYTINEYKIYESVAKFIRLNKDGFFSNTVVNEESSQLNASIKLGMKLMRCLKYFIKNSELLTQVQQLASTYIQKDKIKGTLCFSVHPLDYLSVSETTYNWRSCHALNGDYRAGNLSYMCDSSTIICYLKGEDEAKLPNFPDNVPWNSKKWRMLIFFDDLGEHCFLGRQYPFTVDGILPIIQNKFLPEEWIGFSDQYVKVIHDPLIGEEYENYNIELINKYMPLNTSMGMQLYCLDDVVINETDLHYNDLLHSSYYLYPYYNSKKHCRHRNRTPIKVHVGHEVPCLYCGNNNIKGDGAALMVCEDCDDEYGFSGNTQICDICGERIRDGEDFIVTINGDIVCENCIINEEVRYCDGCGSWFINDSDYIKYYEPTEKYYCTECYRDMVEEE